MTHLPKEELIGILSPSSTNNLDIGGNLGLVNSGWKDLGAISTGFVLTTSYFGNGIAIAGDLAGHIFRSIDYGKSWLDLGDIAGVNSVRTSSYIGNGIAIFGDTAGHIWRSIDFGSSWTDLGHIVGAVTVRSSQYLGNGIVIVGTSGGHIWRSTDFGATWPTNEAITGSAIQTISYLENGIVIFADGSGHIWRSIDFGSSWTDLGLIFGATFFLASSYLGNGIVLTGDFSNHIYRSIDFGLTWADLGAVAGATSIEVISYLGNGITILGTLNNHIWRSADFGITWTDLGAITGTPIYSMLYIGNGISIIGTSNGHIYRNDVSYKLDEAGAGAFLENTGGTLTGSLTINNSNPTLYLDKSGVLYGSIDILGNILEITSYSGSVQLRPSDTTILTATSTGMTSTVPLAMGGHKITGLATATNNGDAVRFEQLTGTYLPLSGGTLTGPLTIQTDSAALYFKNTAGTSTGALIPYAAELDLIGSAAQDVVLDTGAITKSIRLKNIGSDKLTIASAGITAYVALNMDNNINMNGYSLAMDTSGNSYLGYVPTDMIDVYTGGVRRLRIGDTSIIPYVPLSMNNNLNMNGYSLVMDTSGNSYLGFVPLVGVSAIDIYTGGARRLRVSDNSIIASQPLYINGLTSGIYFEQPVGVDQGSIIPYSPTLYISSSATQDLALDVGANTKVIKLRIGGNDRLTIADTSITAYVLLNMDNNINMNGYSIAMDTSGNSYLGYVPLGGGLNAIDIFTGSVRRLRVSDTSIIPYVPLSMNNNLNMNGYSIAMDSSGNNYLGYTPTDMIDIYTGGVRRLRVSDTVLTSYNPLTIDASSPTLNLFQAGIQKVTLDLFGTSLEVICFSGSIIFYPSGFLALTIANTAITPYVVLNMNNNINMNGYSLQMDSSGNSYIGYVPADTIDIFTGGIRRFRIGDSGATSYKPLAMNGNKVTGLAAGTANGDAVRYEQVIGQYLLLSGGTMTGVLNMNNNIIMNGYSLTMDTSGNNYLGYTPTDMIDVFTGGVRRLRVSDTVLTSYKPLTIDTSSPSLTLSQTGVQKVTLDLFGTSLEVICFSGSIIFYPSGLSTLTIASTGMTSTVPLAMSGHKVTDLAAATTNGDAVRYEQIIGVYLPLSGGTMTGVLNMNNNIIMNGYSLTMDTSGNNYLGYTPTDMIDIYTGGVRRLRIGDTGIIPYVPITGNLTIKKDGGALLFQNAAGTSYGNVTSYDATGISLGTLVGSVYLDPPTGGSTVCRVNGATKLTIADTAITAYVALNMDNNIIMNGYSLTMDTSGNNYLGYTPTDMIDVFTGGVRRLRVSDTVLTSYNPLTIDASSPTLNLFQTGILKGYIEIFGIYLEIVSLSGPIVFYPSGISTLTVASTAITALALLNMDNNINMNGYSLQMDTSGNSYLGYVPLVGGANAIDVYTGSVRRLRISDASANLYVPLTMSANIDIGTNHLQFGINSSIYNTGAYIYLYSTDRGIYLRGSGALILETTDNTRDIEFRIASNNRLTIADTVLTSTVPLAMSSNKITGLAAATNNGDAVRFEQINVATYQETTVAGTAVTSVTISGLDINTVGTYILYCTIKNVSAGVRLARIYINGDTTVTNYHSQRFTSSSTTNTGVRVNSPNFTDIDASGNDGYTYSEISIALDSRGITRIISKSCDMTGANVKIDDAVITYNTVIANVTSITVDLDAATSIGIGSNFLLVRANRYG
jgi:hypothetical protein